MGVVRFSRNVGCRHRDGRSLCLGDLAVGRETVPLRDEAADVGALRDDLITDPEKWWRERRKSRVLSAQERENCRGAAAFFLGKTRHVDVVDGGGFEHEAREFTASL